MEKTIKPYQYYFIKREVEQLLNAYSSVNDPKTVQTVQALAAEKIHELLDHPNTAVNEFMEKVLDVTLKKEKAERLLEELKVIVLPFIQPTKPQIDKLFRKVKKLKQPDWNQLDLKEHTYIGWNDLGSQKKFMIYYEEEKLKGISGTLSPTINKGICSICQRTSNVSLFLSTTKTGSDGTYTKKGNYICHDSDQCNQQLVQLAPFYEFTERVKHER
ncbi:elongation factor G-binding protein [Enterococcus durans]|uniref:FusB/FusC family EF-G-binding protein n=1 Tax=Enterococcus durans TaxID=53345 RepID=UPI001431F39E|nr:FusB/FusC family EF-G-binding protein [Enterococcus durans]NJE62867.1 elongation factor G-binding protein [Enterococcus durans]